MRLDLCPQIGDLRLGSGDGIATGDEAARRRLLACNRDQRARQNRCLSGTNAANSTA
jgi:hypothetical protein